MSDFEGQAAVDAADDETSVGTAVAMDDDYTKPRGWRHGATWTYLIMLLASAVALLVSFILSADTLKNGTQSRAEAQLRCERRAVLFHGGRILAGGNREVRRIELPERVLRHCRRIGVRDDRGDRTGQGGCAAWFALCTWLGGLAALTYSYWLTTQSLFVINAMCPWCLVLMFSTTVQFMALSHATVAVQDMPSGHAGLRKYYRLNFDLMVDVV